VQFTIMSKLLCPRLSSQLLFMDDVSVSKLYRQTERHDEADSRFSQFCEKRLKIISVTST